MGIGIYFPIHSGDFNPALAPGQRYRNEFADKRLQNRRQTAQSLISAKGTVCVQNLSSQRCDQVGISRFLNNDGVSLAELIFHTASIDPCGVAGRDLIVPLDSCDVNLALNGRSRLNWSKIVGTSGSSKLPGLQVMPALVIDRKTQDCLGIGDILFHGRPLVTCSKTDNSRLKNERKKLPFEEKESACWSQVACQVAPQLVLASSVNFLMDQGGDIYESIEKILRLTGRDVIVRVNRNRKAYDVDRHQSGTFDQLLAQEEWVDSRKVKLRPLDHVTRTNGRKKIIKRKARWAKINIRCVRVKLNTPDKYPAERPVIEQSLYLIEASEDPSTVPATEKPISWRLLTSWKEMSTDLMWEAIDAYRCRWHIEQVFRVLKNGGLQVERSQVDHPDSFKKLLVMALKVAADAIRLTNARSGDYFVPIDVMFNVEERKVLKALNKRHCGRTAAQTNPHNDDCLAYAAWIIGRLGGWDGYAQHPPGPIKLQRGLNEFHQACLYADLYKDM